ncbi:30S ribosomal protein S11 [Candidatus Pacearchaeota archaeon]|nr:30S ribosomal protein S11 [Candidatus Pacearchaeota archaeon]
MAKEQKETAAIAYIYASFNNTIVHITDLSGNTISRITGGMVTKQDRLKANPTTAMFITKKIEEEIKEHGISNLYVRMRGKTGAQGIGPGANTVVKTLSKDGFNILSISDVTRVPRGGPKKAGGRRGRRV